MAEESCWCCREHGLATPASHDGLCAACANRSPSACQSAHERVGGKTASQHLLEVIEAREREVAAT